MSKRNNKKLLNQIYSRPLPIELSSDKYGVAMPTLFPHNPVSWLFYLTRLIQVNTLYSVPQSLETLIDVSYDSDGIFKVLDEESMAKLWRCGFFGKGTLSRSEPTWKARTIKRLNLDSNTANALSMEEVTNKRRDERKKFKAERSRPVSYTHLDVYKRQGFYSAIVTRVVRKIAILIDLKLRVVQLRITRGAVVVVIRRDILVTVVHFIYIPIYRFMAPAAGGRIAKRPAATVAKNSVHFDFQFGGRVHRQ